MWLVLAVSLFGSAVCTAGNDKYNIKNEIRSVETNITLENENKTTIQTDNIHSNWNTTLFTKKLLFNLSHLEEITTTEADTRGHHQNLTAHTVEGIVKTYNDTQKETGMNVSLVNVNNLYQNEFAQQIENNITPKTMKKLNQTQNKSTRKSYKKNRKRHNTENKQDRKDDLKNYVIKDIQVSLDNNDTYECLEINKSDGRTEYNCMEKLKKNTSAEATQLNRIKNERIGTNIEKWEGRALNESTKVSMYDQFTESIAGQVATLNKTFEINNVTKELTGNYKINKLKEYNITDEEENRNKKGAILEIINIYEEDHSNNKSREKSNEAKERNKNNQFEDYVNNDQGKSEIIEIKQIEKRDKGQEFYSPADKRITHIEEIIFKNIKNNGEHKINNRNNDTNELTTNKIGGVRDITSEKKINEIKNNFQYNSTEKDLSKNKDNISTAVEVKYSKTNSNRFNNITDVLQELNRMDEGKDNSGNINQENNLKKYGFLANSLNQNLTPHPVRQVIDYNNMMIDLISRHNAKAGVHKLSPGSFDKILTDRQENSLTNPKLPIVVSSKIVYVEPGKYIRNTLFTQKLMKDFLSKWPQNFDNKLQIRMSRHMYKDKSSDNSDVSTDALEVRIRKLRSQMFEILLTIQQIKRSLEEKYTRNERTLKTTKKNSSSLKLRQFDKLWSQLYLNYLNESNFLTNSQFNDVVQKIDDDNGSFVNIFKNLFYFLTKRRFHKMARKQRDSPFNSISRSNLNDYAFLKASPYYEIRNLKNLLKKFNIVNQKFIKNIIDSVEKIERKNMMITENEKIKSSSDDLERIVEKRNAKNNKIELLTDSGEVMARRRRNISNIDDIALRYILTLADVLLNEMQESQEDDDSLIVTTDDTKKPNNETVSNTSTQVQQEEAQIDTETEDRLHTELDDHIIKPHENLTTTSLPIETRTKTDLYNYNTSEDKEHMYVSHRTPTTRDVEQINEVYKDKLTEKETESFNSKHAKETTFPTVSSTEKECKAIEKTNGEITAVHSFDHREKYREPVDTNLSLETNTFQAMPSRKFYFYSNDYEQDVPPVPEPKKNSTENVNTFKDEVTSIRKQKDDINHSYENTNGKANLSVRSFKDYNENNAEEFLQVIGYKDQNHMIKKSIEEPRESTEQDDEFTFFDEKPTKIENSSFKLFSDYIDLMDDEIDRTTDIDKSVTKSDSAKTKSSTFSSATEYKNNQKGENTRIKYKEIKKIEEEGESSKSINQQNNNGYHFNSEGLLESITDEPESHNITNKILMNKNRVLLDYLDYGLASINEKDGTNKSESSIEKSNNKIDTGNDESFNKVMANTKFDKYVYDYQDNPAENTNASFNSVKQTNPDVNLEDKLNKKIVEERSDSARQLITEFEKDGDNDNDKGNDDIEGFQDPGEIEDSF